MVSSLPIRIPQALQVTDEQFSAFVAANPDLRLERTATGELIIMPPTGSESGNYNFELNTDLGIWNRQARLGKAFDSSTGFRLPNGATRSPDSAWIINERWNKLTPQQRRGFAPICPDFVLELASETDSADTLRQKMQEYIENGCRLGWLIIPKTQQVEIFRSGQMPELLQSPEMLSGEAVLPGFVLNLQLIFDL
ncbi:MAG: Uma2 family endonuclease [Thermosynechococcaceae cyanobacterium]